jgi:hypothetical protein
MTHYESSVTAISCIPSGGHSRFIEASVRDRCDPHSPALARTPGRVASVPHDALDADPLDTLAAAHQRET